MGRAKGSPGNRRHGRPRQPGPPEPAQPVGCGKAQNGFCCWPMPSAPPPTPGGPSSGPWHCWGRGSQHSQALLQGGSPGWGGGGGFRSVPSLAAVEPGCKRCCGAGEGLQRAWLSPSPASPKGRDSAPWLPGRLRAISRPQGSPAGGKRRLPPRCSASLSRGSSRSGEIQALLPGAERAGNGPGSAGSAGRSAQRNPEEPVPQGPPSQPDPRRRHGDDPKPGSGPAAPA